MRIRRLRDNVPLRETADRILVHFGERLPQPLALFSIERTTLHKTSDGPQAMAQGAQVGRRRELG